MSFERVPTRSEVMGWGPQQLADYLKKMNLSGCDKVVMKNGINGSRFINLSENDLQKFPKLHAPLISKISTNIGKKEERRGLFNKKTTPKYHEQAFLPPDNSHEPQGWGEDEFEDFDDDYESPYSGEDDGSDKDYESPTDDPNDPDYEPNPTAPPEDLPQKLCKTLPIADTDYIDNRNNHVSSRGAPPVVSPRPPVNSLTAPSPCMPGESSFRRDPSPHSGGRPSGNFPTEPPQIFRGNKPGRGSGSTSTPIRGPQRNTVGRTGADTPPWRSQPDTPDPPSWPKPPALPPHSTSVGRSNSSVRAPNMFDARKEQMNEEVPKHNTFPLQNRSVPPRPGLPGPPSRHGDSLPPNVPSALLLHQKPPSGPDRQSFRQDLDPSWYVGKVTRGQAEGCLKRVRKDGAYLVRDSTRQQANQPFTLMVFYQDKVFNIQIRQQNNQFLLGTGLKVQEFFPSVNGIISHYSQSPLLLIDAKNRQSSQQNQCMLSDPAGYHMSGQSWS